MVLIKGLALKSVELSFVVNSPTEVQFLHWPIEKSSSSILMSMLMVTLFCMGL